MEDADRDRLVEHRSYFTKNVDVRSLFTPLMQDGILTVDDCERVQAEGRTTAERAEAFLDLLPRKGPTAFAALCRALRPHHRFVLQNLGLSEEELRRVDDDCQDGMYPLRRANSEERISSTLSPTNGFTGFSVRCAADRLQELIELLETVSAERDQLLSELAERQQDSLELKQVRTCQEMLEQSNVQLQRERDGALEQLALLRGQCGILRAEYNEARSNAQQLREEVHSRSDGVENHVLRRLCSESSAKFEIEKANHMKTQLELNEIRAKHERSRRELEQLQELKDNMATNIEELKGSLRKSEAENLFQRAHTSSLRGDLENMRLSRSPSKSGVSRLQQQITLLKWQKGQCEIKLEEVEAEAHELREQYDVARHEHQQTRDELEAKVQELFSACRDRDALIEQFNNLSTYTNDVVGHLHEMEVHWQEASQQCQDLDEECRMVLSRLQTALAELERLRDDFDHASEELSKERCARMEAVRKSMSHESDIDKRQRQNKELRSRLRSGERAQKALERENDELQNIVQVAQMRLDDAKEKMSGCVKYRDDGVVSDVACSANTWKLQQSLVTLGMEGTVLPGVNVQWGLFVDNINTDSPLAGQLSPGNRIIKVNDMPVNKLPTGCVEDGILVSPRGNSTNAQLTVSVEQPTLPGCDEALAILQEPPLSSCFDRKSFDCPPVGTQIEIGNQCSDMVPHRSLSIGPLSTLSATPSIVLSTSTSSSGGSMQVQNRLAKSPVGDESNGCGDGVNKMLSISGMRRSGIVRQLSRSQSSLQAHRFRYLKPVRGFTSATSPRSEDVNMTFPRRSPSPQRSSEQDRKAQAKSLPRMLDSMPESRRIPIVISPSVWKERLNVRPPDESVSSSDESYHQPRQQSARHSSLPNILDDPSVYSTSCAYNRMSRDLMDVVDRIRSPSLKVLLSQCSVLRRSSVSERLSDDSSSDDRSPPGEGKSSTNSDGGLQRGEENGIMSPGAEHDSGLADELKDGCLEGSRLTIPESGSPDCQNDVTSMRKRSRVVYVKRRGRERRSDTLPENYYPGTASWQVVSRAVKSNVEDLIGRMETPVVLPNQRQSTSRLKDQGCKTVNIHCSRSGDIGVNLRGGRGHGLFILSLTPGSPAAVSGLVHAGDEIVGVNGKDLSMATYEEAVVSLKSCPLTVQLTIGQNCVDHQMASKWNVRDTFFVRALYSHASRRTPGEMTILAGDILCVIDTAYQDQIGNWYAYKLSSMGSLVDKGSIPSHQRASQLICGYKQSLSPPTQRRPANMLHILLRSASTDVSGERGKVGGLKTCLVPGAVIVDQNIMGYNVSGCAKLQHSLPIGSYCCVEKSSFKFRRPVVLLGPVADLVVGDLCDGVENGGAVFCRPEDIQDDNDGTITEQGQETYITTGNGLHVSVQHIMTVADQGFHCLFAGLNETAIQNLRAVGLHPIVIYLDPKNQKKISRAIGIRDVNAGVVTSSQKERDNLMAAGLLSAKLKSGGRLNKTVGRVADLIKLLQEAFYWLPSDVQL